MNGKPADRILLLPVNDLALLLLLPLARRLPPCLQLRLLVFPALLLGKALPLLGKPNLPFTADRKEPLDHSTPLA